MDPLQFNYEKIALNTLYGKEKLLESNNVVKTSLVEFIIHIRRKNVFECAKANIISLIEIYKNIMKRCPISTSSANGWFNNAVNVAIYSTLSYISSLLISRSDIHICKKQYGDSLESIIKYSLNDLDKLTMRVLGRSRIEERYNEILSIVCFLCNSFIYFDNLNNSNDQNNYNPVRNAIEKEDFFTMFNVKCRLNDAEYVDAFLMLNYIFGKIKYENLYERPCILPNQFISTMIPHGDPFTVFRAYYIGDAFMLGKTYLRILTSVVQDYNNFREMESDNKREQIKEKIKNHDFQISKMCLTLFDYFEHVYKFGNNEEVEELFYFIQSVCNIKTVDNETRIFYGILEKLKKEEPILPILGDSEINQQNEFKLFKRLLSFCFVNTAKKCYNKILDPQYGNRVYFELIRKLRNLLSKMVVLDKIKKYLGNITPIFYIKSYFDEILAQIKDNNYSNAIEKLRSIFEKSVYQKIQPHYDALLLFLWDLKIKSEIEESKIVNLSESIIEQYTQKRQFLSSIYEILTMIASIDPSNSIFEINSSMYGLILNQIFLDKLVYPNMFCTCYLLNDLYENVTNNRTGTVGRELLSLNIVCFLYTYVEKGLLTFGRSFVQSCKKIGIEKLKVIEQNLANYTDITARLIFVEVLGIYGIALNDTDSINDNRNFIKELLLRKGKINLSHLRKSAQNDVLNCCVLNDTHFTATNYLFILAKTIDNQLYFNEEIKKIHKYVYDNGNREEIETLNKLNDALSRLYPNQDFSKQSEKI